MLQEAGSAAALANAGGMAGSACARNGATTQRAAGGPARRAALIGWMERTRAALDDFNAGFRFVWGDDRSQEFREDIIPAYCIARP